MGYQVKSGGITRELDKEPLLHCSSIYINTMWSMLQQCVYLMSIHHASSSCPITHPHVFSLRPPYFVHVPWHHTFNLRCTCAHYEELLSLDIISNPNSTSRLLLILLDHSRLYHMTFRSHAYLLSLFHCRLIIIILNPNPSPSLSTLLSYNNNQ